MIVEMLDHPRLAGGRTHSHTDSFRSDTGELRGVDRLSRRTNRQLGGAAHGIRAQTFEPWCRIKPFDLATALMGAGDAEGAVNELLELFRRDREWNDGAAKAQLFKIFESLGDKDPVALTGRRRLSSMIFM